MIYEINGADSAIRKLLTSAFIIQTDTNKNIRQSKDSMLSFQKFKCRILFYSMTAQY